MATQSPISIYFNGSKDEILKVPEKGKQSIKAQQTKNTSPFYKNLPQST